MLQNGIYYQGGMPKAFRLLQLNFDPGTTSVQCRNALKILWDMLTDLADGKIGDLRKEHRTGEADVILDGGELQTMLGYGSRLFDSSIHNPTIVDSAQKPRRLAYLRSKGKRAPFSKLHWKVPEDENINPTSSLSTQSDIAFQFTGNTELTVNRAMVEVSKSISDHDLPLTISNFYSGFRREDKRSWIDFHDGINNLTPSERLQAIEITGNEKDWMLGGTFMSFLQIHVDLEEWRKLSREFQELIVGRDKVTSCPLVSSELETETSTVKPVFMKNCPVNFDLSGPLTEALIAPPQPSNKIAQSAHIYRSNFNRDSPSLPASNRIYRQGYEFVEPDSNGGLLHGLNFIAFHRSIKFVTDILSQKFWMGDVNFGGLDNSGDGEPPNVALMQLLNGAFYAVPPDNHSFPGAVLFSKDKIAERSLYSSLENRDAYPKVVSMGIPHARKGGADDFEVIIGIGPKTKDLLNLVGVFHFDQIANLTIEDLDSLDARSKGIKTRALKNNWIMQAQQIAKS